MSTIVLGISGALNHDPSAALYVDEKLVAAAEEERFIRDKHAKGKMPINAAKFCLDYAGIKPEAVDVVAVPFAPISIFSKARWHFARRYWYAPDRALDALLNGNRRYRRYRDRVFSLLRDLGIDPNKVEFEPVEHHLAHASSAYHLSGFTEKTAIMGWMERVNTPRHSLVMVKMARFIRSKSFMTLIHWVGSMGQSLNTLGLKCSMVNTRLWVWRPMVIPPNTIFRD